MKWGNKGCSSHPPRENRFLWGICEFCFREREMSWGGWAGTAPGAETSLKSEAKEWHSRRAKPWCWSQLPVCLKNSKKPQIKPPGKAQGQWNNSLTLLKLYKMPIFIYRLKCLTIPQCRLMINQCPANQSIEFRSNQHLTGFIRATEGEGFKKKIKIKLNGSNVPLYYRQIINTLQRKSGGKIIKMQSFSGYMVRNMKKKQEVRVWR